MKFNNAFFEDLGRSPGVVGLVDEAAQRIAARARSTAPVDTGEYRDGIRVTRKFQKRVVGLVQATDRKSMLIEAKDHTLLRALQAEKRTRRG